MKANTMTICKSLVLMLLLTPAFTASTAEQDASAEGEAETVIWHVVLLNGDEFYAEEVKRSDRTVTYRRDEPGSNRANPYNLNKVDWAKTKPEQSRKRADRVEEQYRELGQVKVTRADGSVGYKDKNEVDRAELAFEMAANLEVSPPPMPEPDPAADSAAEAALEEEAQQPGSMGLWGARIILLAVAALIVGVLLKTMVLASPEPV